jgi:hypothetical protein
MHAPARGMAAKRTHFIVNNIRLAIVYSSSLGNVR